MKSRGCGVCVQIFMFWYPEKILNGSQKKTKNLQWHMSFRPLNPNRYVNDLGQTYHFLIMH